MISEQNPKFTNSLNKYRRWQNEHKNPANRQHSSEHRFSYVLPIALE